MGEERGGEEGEGEMGRGRDGVEERERERGRGGVKESGRGREGGARRVSLLLLPFIDSQSPHNLAEMYIYRKNLDHLST